MPALNPPARDLGCGDGGCLPRADAAPPPTITVYRVQATVGDPDPADPQEARERESTFVLITKLPTADDDSRCLLEEPKGQTAVNQRSHFRKDPALGIPCLCRS